VLLVIHGNPHRDVIYLPRQAVMLKDSQPVVYVRTGSSFEPRQIKVQAENESRAAVEGIPVGTEIAMIDPTAPRRSSNSAASAAPTGGQP
jgi:hypothetical protein